MMMVTFQVRRQQYFSFISAKERTGAPATGVESCVASIVVFVVILFGSDMSDNSTAVSYHRAHSWFRNIIVAHRAGVPV